MDPGRYRELYLSETQEYLAALNRGLLALEAGEHGETLDEAFRAAHTIKGMSATLGYDEVARVAHELEDRLDEVRTGAAAVDRALIDELLAAADALEAAVEAAVAGGAAPAGAARGKAAGAKGAAKKAAARKGSRQRKGSNGGAAAGNAERAGNGSAVRADEPAERALGMHVVSRPAAPLGGARAVLVRRNAADIAPVLRAEPEDPAASWDGVLRLWFPMDADRAALERAARA